MHVNRRSFIKKAAVLTASPFIIPSSVWSAEVNPNDRITVGFIGMGKQNRGLVNIFMNHKRCQVIAVCEVDTTRRNAAVEQVNAFYAARPSLGSADCAAYNDFRDLIGRTDIDVVCIATPDHWHAIQAIAAVQSGKDVYCEKPLTHNIHEARELMKAVNQHRRILQTGSMQRSMREFRIACELVRNGAIGRISHVTCNFGPPGIPCDLPEEEMEPGLDWDMWIGPAPMRPYHSKLSPRGIHDHFPDWRDYREFGGGMVTDWGAHHLDIAQWGLGKDDSGPIEVYPPENPDAKKGAMLLYEDNIKVIHGGDIGVHFYGDLGEVKVDRGKFEFWREGKKVAGFLSREDGGTLAAALDFVEKEFLANASVKLYASMDHVKNFLNCVESREKPITCEEIGGRSAICCHLMNQAYYNHAVIKWQPREMCFAPGNGNPEWLTRNYRSPRIV